MSFSRSAKPTPANIRRRIANAHESLEAALEMINRYASTKPTTTRGSIVYSRIMEAEDRVQQSLRQVAMAWDVVS